MKIPSLKLHKGTGQSYVWWKGKAVYFGKHGEPSTDKAYWRWRESLGVEAAGGRTVSELLELYESNHSISRRDKSRLNNLKDALPGIGGLEVNTYGPAIFRQHREQVASTGTRSARQVNDLMQFMRRIVKWGAEKGFCKPEVWTNLGIVKRLDRSDIPIEPKIIKPANPDDVMATMGHLKDTPWAIVRLLMLTGARPSEIVSLRTARRLSCSVAFLTFWHVDKYSRTCHLFPPLFVVTSLSVKSLQLFYTKSLFSIYLS